MLKTLASIMKRFEEVYTSQKLSIHSPVVVRLDGRSFHRLTKHMDRPFDSKLSSVMINTTKYLIKEFAAIGGYTQSDEISLYWCVGDEFTLFDGQLFKINSVLASSCSSYFNERATYENLPLPYLSTWDCRAFNLPSVSWLLKYLRWRERDAIKNSVTSAARFYFPDSQLFKKKTADKLAMLLTKDVDWNNYPTHFKQGTYLYRKLAWQTDKNAFRHEVVEVSSEDTHYFEDKINA